MQVDVAGSGPVPWRTRQAQALVLPELLQLLQGPADARSTRGQQLAQHEERLRQHDDAMRDAFAAPTATQRYAEDVARAERRGQPGSRSAFLKQLQSQKAQDGPPAPQSPPDRKPPAETAQQPSTPKSEAAPKPAIAPRDTETARASNAPSQRPEPQPPEKPTETRAPQPAQSVNLAALNQAARQTTQSLQANTSTATQAATVSGVTKTAGAQPTTPPTVAAGRTPPPGTSPAATAPGRGKAVPADPQGAGAPQEGDETRKADANTQRMLRLIQARLGKDHSTATLRLDPPELGKIKLQMDLQQNNLTLQIDTQTSAARHLLSEQLETLRHSLEVAGIQLERVEVRAPAATSAADQPEQQPTAHSDQQEAALADEQGRAHDEADNPVARQGDTEVSGEEVADEPGTEATHAGPAAETLVNIVA